MLLLQVGEWYKRRDGRIVGPVEPNNIGTRFVFRVGRDTYTKRGRLTDEYLLCGEDLVEHIPRTDPRHPEYKPASAPVTEQPETVEVTVRVPKPPDGWRVDGHRWAVCGERVLDVYDVWSDPIGAGGTYTAHLVAVPFTPPWKPPASLAAGWVVAEEHRVLWSQCEPKWDGDGWTGVLNGCVLNSAMFRDWTPPPIRGEHAIWRIE